MVVTAVAVVEVVVAAEAVVVADAAVNQVSGKWLVTSSIDVSRFYTGYFSFRRV